MKKIVITNNKKRKGFTLIELLAVIVILAIIAVIATPIILGIVESTRKDAFQRSAELLLKSTDLDLTNKMMGKNESSSLIKYEVVSVGKCVDYLVEEWRYNKAKALIDCSLTEPLTLIEYINVVSKFEDYFIRRGYIMFEQAGAIAKNDDGIYEMIDSDICVDVNVNEWEYDEFEAGGYCKKDAIYYLPLVVWVSTLEEDDRDVLELLEEGIIRKKTNTIDYTYEIIDGKINPVKIFEGYEIIDTDKCIEYLQDEWGETLEQAQSTCANEERTLLEDINLLDEEAFNNHYLYPYLLEGEVPAIEKNASGKYEIIDSDDCAIWFNYYGGYSIDKSTSICNGGIWIKKLTDAYLENLNMASGLVYNDILRVKWNTGTTIATNTEGMNGIIEYDENGKSVYAISNGKYCVRKTKDMTKSQIIDYEEGNCEPIDYTYTDESCFTYEEGDTGIVITDYTCDITDVVIPNKLNDIDVTEIGASAFEEKGLTSVVLPTTIEKIRRYAFSDNQITGIIDLDRLTNLTRVESGAFYINQLSGAIIPRNFLMYENGDPIYIECPFYKNLDNFVARYPDSTVLDWEGLCW